MATGKWMSRVVFDLVSFNTDNSEIFVLSMPDAHACPRKPIRNAIQMIQAMILNIFNLTSFTLNLG